MPLLMRGITELALSMASLPSLVLGVATCGVKRNLIIIIFLNYYKEKSSLDMCI